VKLRSEQFAQAFDAAEVSFVNGASCSYLDTRVSATTLYDGVDFVAVLVSPVIEGQAFCMRSSLPFQFTETNVSSS
jgi:hypothetical protein